MLSRTLCPRPTSIHAFLAASASFAPFVIWCRFMLTRMHNTCGLRNLVHSYISDNKVAVLQEPQYQAGSTSYLRKQHTQQAPTWLAAV